MHSLSNAKTVTAPAAVMPNAVPARQPAADAARDDFLRHPRQFPLEAKRMRTWRRSSRAVSSPSGDVGLCFVSQKYIPTGSEMELSIPLRGDVQKFHGHVVMVREIADGYEIGVWLASADEASRARLVEQICALECALQTGRPAPHRITN